MSSRRASTVKVGGFRPTGDPFATHFGLRPLSLPHESWPELNGAPMLFVCQLNLTAAPAVPDSLKDVALITFFVDPKHGNLAQENGKDWHLRVYHSLDGLVTLDPPANAPALKRGFECSWTAGVDHEQDQDDFENLAYTKLGGYPSTIQSEPWWDDVAHPAQPHYCLQINSEEKVGLFWGDVGMVYLARGTEDGFTDHWFLDWQCY
jgi:uncharacterized protein YwqG